VSDALNLAYQGVDNEWSDESASTRRRFVQGAAATLGGLGVFGLLADDRAIAQMGQNDPQTILNIAATAEVLATIVNTVGPEKLGRGRGRRSLDRVTRRNVRAAARQELIHYEVLTSIGAKELTKRIWVPDAAFASRTGLLETLEAGDQIFVNAYLIGTTVFAGAGKSAEARYTGEFMGVEAVHRALARQSLGKLGNDRVFMRYDFTDITDAVKALEKAGFGFGQKGSAKGRFYDFDQVRRRTPNPAGVNTRKPS
jgi:hypothetical protein